MSSVIKIRIPRRRLGPNIKLTDLMRQIAESMSPKTGMETADADSLGSARAHLCANFTFTMIQVLRASDGAKESPLVHQLVPLTPSLVQREQ